MAESSFEQQLKQMLEYPEMAQAETFVLDVMRGVRRQQRTRRFILWSFGGVGAVFGLLGAVMLSDSISRLFSFTVSLTATEIMQAVLLVVAVGAFYTWMMNDDLPLGH